MLFALASAPAAPCALAPRRRRHRRCPPRLAGDVRRLAAPPEPTSCSRTRTSSSSTSRRRASRRAPRDLRDRRAAGPLPRSRTRSRRCVDPARAAAGGRVAHRDPARLASGAPRGPRRSGGSAAFTQDAAIVAHTRFDLAFLDREVTQVTGRIAAPVVDTVWLARRLLGERTRRGLGARSRTSSASPPSPATAPCRTHGRPPRSCSS